MSERGAAPASSRLVEGSGSGARRGLRRDADLFISSKSRKRNEMSASKARTLRLLCDALPDSHAFGVRQLLMTFKHVGEVKGRQGRRVDRSLPADLSSDEGERFPLKSNQVQVETGEAESNRAEADRLFVRACARELVASPFSSACPHINWPTFKNVPSCRLKTRKGGGGRRDMAVGRLTK